MRLSTRSRRIGTRGLPVLCSVLMIGSATSAVRVSAAETGGPPAVQKERVLPYSDAALGSSAVPTPSSGSALTATSWPSAGTADVTVPAGSTRARAGTLPVLLSAKRAATTPAAAAEVSTSVRVRVADQATAASARVGGMLFSITRTAASTTPLSVALDYSSFRNAAGANFGQRLRLVSLPACALTTPTVPACQVQTPIASSNDAARQLLTATVGSTASAPTSAVRGSAPLASAAGSGTVLAAVSRDPLNFDAFVRNDHWDFRARNHRRWRMSSILS